MRAYLFLWFVMVVTILLSPSILLAQDALTDKFSRKKKLQLQSHVPLVHKAADKSSKGFLRGNSDFTDPEVNEIFNRLVEKTGRPVGIATEQLSVANQASLSHYTAYNLFDFSLLGNHFVLVWLPCSENQNLPAELRPTDSRGYLFYTGKEPTAAINKKGKIDAKAIAQARINKPSSTGYKRTGIQISSADMSQYTQKGNLGTIILYYGSGGVGSSAYTFELGGKALAHKEGVAAVLPRQIGLSDLKGFEHRQGSNCPTSESYLLSEVGKAVSSRCMGDYNVDQN